MKNTFFKTIVFIVLFLIPSCSLANVVINEITWMGTTTDYNDEWLELKNTSSASVDLTGWILEAVDGQPKINLSGTISANAYFLLERTNNDSVPEIAADQIYTGALGNSGEYLKLKNAANNVIDEIDTGGGWPAGDNTTKQTMERTTTGWQTSLNPGGTPKAQNSSGAIEEPEQTPEQPETPSMPTGTNTPPIAEAGDNIIAFVNQEIKLDGTQSSDPEGNELQYSWNTGDGNSLDKMTITHKYLYPGTYLATLTVFDGRFYTTDTITIKIQNQGITINEFMANPSGKDEEEEWIEIYNDADEIMDISGWQLDDVASGSKPFVFPKNTLIAPKSYVVFTRQVTGIALNNDKDSVRLLMPEGVVFQEINYEKPPLGKSSARTADGFIWSESSPGTANIVLASIEPSESTKFIYQNQIESEIVQEPKDYVINYQNAGQQKIEGGYQEIAMTDNQLASVKQPQTTQSPTNLILIIVIIVLGALIIGIALIKFRRKNLIIK